MILINVGSWNEGSYSEIGQTNPLRWQNIKLVGPDTYEPVSKWWKCKDFMNEVVTSFHLERDFSIYGFQVTHSEFFNKGDTTLPILLKNVSKSFLVNMGVVNDHLLNEGYPAVEVYQHDIGAFIKVPLEYLTNTLFMSQVTLFIRLANTEKEYTTLPDMLKDKHNGGDEANFNACLKKPLGSFPTSLSEYLWYYNEERNCRRDLPKDKNIQTSLMHNCGVVSWANSDPKYCQGWAEQEECV
jgi:hypothetical protein